MGLVGFIIVPAFTASHCVSMSPLAFIKDASVWALLCQSIAPHIAVPPTGYALAARKTSDAVRDRVDSSSVCARQSVLRNRFAKLHLMHSVRSSAQLVFSGRPSIAVMAWPK